MENRRKFLTSRDVMERYQITETTLYRYIKSGVLIPPIKMGGVNRWAEADLDAWDKAKHADIGRTMAPIEEWIEDEVKEEASGA